MAAKKKPELTHYETEWHVYCGDEVAIASLIAFLLPKHWWFEVKWHTNEFRLTCNADLNDLRKAKVGIQEFTP